MLYAARRSVESGPRLDNYDSNSIREVIGAKGGWGDAWTYDVYGQYGITKFADSQGGYLGVNQINNALNVIPNPATGGVKGVPVGAAVCAATVAGIDPACVPWNIWNANGVTAAQLAYLEVNSTYATTATEYIVDGSVTGDLGKYGLKFPTAATGINVNVGTEYRQETYDFNPDYIFSNGFASGGNGAAHAINGTFHVNEYYFETNIPIADNMTGINHLDFEGGYRYSDYTSGFKTDTFKLGLVWAPIQDLKLRGSFNRAVRAPNIGVLFSPAYRRGRWRGRSVLGLDALVVAGGLRTYRCNSGSIRQNPCQPGGADPPRRLVATPRMTPEKADTYTFDFVLQPVALPALSVSVDYYDIKIDDTITSLTSNTVIQNCALTGDAQLCGLIHRGAGTGRCRVQHR